MYRFETSESRSQRTILLPPISTGIYPEVVSPLLLLGLNPEERNAFQHQGITTALIEYAIACCPKAGDQKRFAIVLESNKDSSRLLERQGFQK